MVVEQQSSLNIRSLSDVEFISRRRIEDINVVHGAEGIG